MSFSRETQEKAKAGAHGSNRGSQGHAPPLRPGMDHPIIQMQNSLGNRNTAQLFGQRTPSTQGQSQATSPAKATTSSPPIIANDVDFGNQEINIMSEKSYVHPILIEQNSPPWNFSIERGTEPWAHYTFYIEGGGGRLFSSTKVTSEQISNAKITIKFMPRVKATFESSLTIKAREPSSGREYTFKVRLRGRGREKNWRENDAKVAKAKRDEEKRQELERLKARQETVGTVGMESELRNVLNEYQNLFEKQEKGILDLENDLKTKDEAPPLSIKERLLKLILTTAIGWASGGISFMIGTLGSIVAGSLKSPAKKGGSPVNTDLAEKIAEKVDGGIQDKLEENVTAVANKYEGEPSIRKFMRAQYESLHGLKDEAQEQVSLHMQDFRNAPDGEFQATKLHAALEKQTARARQEQYKVSLVEWSKLWTGNPDGSFKEGEISLASRHPSSPEKGKFTISAVHEGMGLFSVRSARWPGLNNKTVETLSSEDYKDYKIRRFSGAILRVKIYASDLDKPFILERFPNEGGKVRYPPALEARQWLAGYAAGKQDLDVIAREIMEKIMHFKLKGLGKIKN